MISATTIAANSILTSPTSGTLRIQGQDFSRLSDAERTKLRRAHIGFIFQRFNLLPTISAYDNIELAHTIAATGKVVAPGFIDLLSYMPDDHGTHYKIADGVTTNLGMHGLDIDATSYFQQYTDRCMVNFGGAYRYLEVRGEAEIVADDDYVFADQVGAKYEADLRQHDGPGDRRVVVTIRPRPTGDLLKFLPTPIVAGAATAAMEAQ